VTEGVTIHVVDDDGNLRAAMNRLLTLLGYAVVAYGSAEDFLAADPRGPGCVLLDVQMPGLDGLALHERLVQAGNPLPVVFLSAHGDIPTSVRAIKRGAEDFLTKPFKREELVEAVERALARDRASREAVARKAARQARLDTLTPREREVLGYVIRGRLNKQVAADLGTTERTIKAHRAAIAEKLGLRSAAEMATFCNGLDLGRESAK
jgi:FixJ family two-component response regulator